MPTDTPTKPKPPGKKADLERVATDAAVAATEAAVEASARGLAATMAGLRDSVDAIASSRAKLDKPPGKLGAEKLTPEEQRRRFIESAREAGTSEDEADFDAALKRIAKPKQGQI